MSLANTKLQNLCLELQLAYAKQSELEKRNLATDQIDERIMALKKAINQQRVILADEKLRAEMGLL